MKKTRYRWDGNISVGSDQFRLIAVETMREHGYNVLGGDDLLFSNDKSTKATYQIGGTVTDLRVNTFDGMAGDKAETWIQVEWQLNNALQEKIVFSSVTEGNAEVPGQESAGGALREAFRGALKNLLADEEFVAFVRAPGDSIVAGLAEANAMEIATCSRPVATALPADIEEAFKAAPVVRVGGGHGSAVVISPEGYLLTAAHVVSGVDNAAVKFQSGMELQAEVLALDPAQDIALLRIPGSGHACLALADAGPAPVGSNIFAIGAPADEHLSFSVSRGIVSGHRNLDNYVFLQTDTSVNPGNSGGPLLNEAGQIVGIVSFKIAGTLFEGLGFGVPPTVLRERLGLRLR